MRPSEVSGKIRFQRDYLPLTSSAFERVKGVRKGFKVVALRVKAHWVSGDV